MQNCTGNHTRQKQRHHWNNITSNAKDLEPFTAQPAVEELQARLRLVHGDHVATAVQTHKGEVAVRLHLSDLLALVLILLDHKVLQLGRGELLLAGPLKSLGPGLVTEPVADKIGVTGVDKHGDLLEETRHQAVEGLHPVTMEEEVAVDVEVARIIAFGLGTKGLANTLLVEVVGNIAHALVAEVRLVLALATDIVDVLASLLVGCKKGVVAVNRGRNTDPGTLAVVAGFNHGLATRQGVIHRLAAALIQNSRVATVAASHWAVVLILGQAVSQTVSDKHRLEVDIALLVGQDLRSEGRDIVASVRLASDVEILLGILGELLEKEGQQGVDVLARGHSVAHGGATVGVAHIHGLVQEDHRSIGVPGEVIVDGLDLAVDRAGPKLHEEASKGGASGTTVQPEDNGVVFGVVARLEEPYRPLERGCGNTQIRCTHNRTGACHSRCHRGNHCTA